MAFVLLLSKPAGHVQKGSEQRGAVIVGQLDEPGFLHETAEFDEVAGTGTSILDPLALVISGSGGVEPTL